MYSFAGPPIAKSSQLCVALGPPVAPPELHLHLLLDISGLTHVTESPLTINLSSMCVLFLSWILGFLRLTTSTTGASI